MLARSMDGLHFCNSYARLPGAFYTRLQPLPVRNPRLLHANPDVARLIGLDPAVFKEPEFTEVFAGNRPLPGGEPLATVYSGHQFGVWAGQLGDGRAHLLGEVKGPCGRFELQLKGSGLTPYSRMGDGRAVLRSSVREYLACAAMDGLGIPTTHALCIIAADDPVRRETLETAAVVTRVAPSFVRFGHFEHWAATGRHDHLATLANYVIDRFYPECREVPAGEADYPGAPVVRMLDAVMRRTARLLAQWQAVGFMHGVMNTDNMSILGLTLDYGPYGFMDGFDARHICNHSDTMGRYAWNTQPMIAHWNLYRLAEALYPLVGATEPLLAVLEQYEAEFTRHFHGIMAVKLGLREFQDGDADLLEELWRIMHAQRADFTQTFRRLARVPCDEDDITRPTPSGNDAPAPSASGSADPAGLEALFHDLEPVRAWLARYRARVASDRRPPRERQDTMLRANPAYVLRNHLAELAIQAARHGDASEIDRLLTVLRDPYAERPGFESYAALPPAWASSLEVSCSS